MPDVVSHHHELKSYVKNTADLNSLEKSLSDVMTEAPGVIVMTTMKSSQSTKLKSTVMSRELSDIFLQLLSSIEEY